MKKNRGFSHQNRQDRSMDVDLKDFRIFLGYSLSFLCFLISLLLGFTHFPPHWLSFVCSIDIRIGTFSGVKRLRS